MCSQQDSDEFRERLLHSENDFLVLLFNMLEHRLTDIEDPAIQILGQLASHGTTYPLTLICSA